MQLSLHYFSQLIDYQQLLKLVLVQYITIGYKITILLGDREVFKTTLYCPHESMIEAELKSFLQEVSLLEKEGAKAEN